MYKILFISLFMVLQSFYAQAAPLWKISKGDDFVIIGGTIHVLSATDYPLPEEFEKAYQASDTLVFESDIVRMNSPEFQQQSLQYILLQDGKTIKDFLSEQTYQDLETHLQQRNLSLQQFSMLKPSFLSVTLSMIELQMMGVSSAGVDVYYSTKGMGDQKQAKWFEEPEEQMAMLADMGKGEEDAMIAYSLKDVAKIKEMMPKLINAWRAGDLDKLAEIGIDEMQRDYPEIYDQLLVQRNKNWLPKIEQLFDNQQNELILVGALHLAGEQSVLKLMQEKGYSIEKY
ncbi:MULTISPECIES: TraB/GumN family protein [Alteromonadaceae]|uniref:TraB/GumN family protein n=1 Tax=Alteromonadaceae TaxID=72275 RepID=UPI001C09E5C5|nr:MULTISPECIES: TraB/GumN family protein [Aliiglaciecola]MBU2877178.1 TraB/GumN family protein [Aliiglaciecola lipolytica]MDO6712108.1 TraB/GumN family protein [Aliiglaciecola sp. 2_MG-2023]MDO6753188.1 TraB/GumN family protein [Aliiglaciecola sp. 1_MG-2023]